MRNNDICIILQKRHRFVRKAQARKCSESQKNNCQPNMRQTRWTDGGERDTKSVRQSGKERREACWTIRGGREDENIVFLSVRFPSVPLEAKPRASYGETREWNPV